MIEFIPKHLFIVVRLEKLMPSHKIGTTIIEMSVIPILVPYLNVYFTFSILLSNYKYIKFNDKMIEFIPKHLFLVVRLEKLIPSHKIGTTIMSTQIPYSKYVNFIFKNLLLFILV